MSDASAQWLVTGGSGLLGGELKPMMPGALFPTSAEFNVCDYESLRAYVAGKSIAGVLHAGAFTSPPKINEDPVRALQVNIIGTANVVRLCAEQGWRRKLNRPSGERDRSRSIGSRLLQISKRGTETLNKAS